MFRDREIKCAQLSPLALAYLGDAVYELYIRTKLVEQHPVSVQRLHQMAVKYVQASKQAGILHAWEQLLTAEEKDVARRGRNVKSSIPRGGTASDYRHSTGFEALIGHLYLSGQLTRLKELLNTIDPAIDQQEE